MGMLSWRSDSWVEVVKGQSISRTGQNLPRTRALPFSVLPWDLGARQGLRGMTWTGTVVRLEMQRHHHGDTEGSQQLSGWVGLGWSCCDVPLYQSLATSRCACCFHVKIGCLISAYNWDRTLNPSSVDPMTCETKLSQLFLPLYSVSLILALAEPSYLLRIHFSLLRILPGKS